MLSKLPRSSFNQWNIRIIVLISLAAYVTNGNYNSHDTKKKQDELYLQSDWEPAVWCGKRSWFVWITESDTDFDGTFGFFLDAYSSLFYGALSGIDTRALTSAVVLNRDKYVWNHDFSLNTWVFCAFATQCVSTFLPRLNFNRSMKKLRSKLLRANVAAPHEQKN